MCWNSHFARMTYIQSDIAWFIMNCQWSVLMLVSSLSIGLPINNNNTKTKDGMTMSSLLAFNRWLIYTSLTILSISDLSKLLLYFCFYLFTTYCYYWQYVHSLNNLTLMVPPQSLFSSLTFPARDYQSSTKHQLIIIIIINNIINNQIDSDINFASSTLPCNWYNFILASNCSLICL